MEWVKKCGCGLCEEDFAAQQKSDYVRAMIVAPIALIVVWVLACGVLLAFVK